MQFKSTGAKILTHCVIGMIGHKPCSHHHDHEKRLVKNIAVIIMIGKKQCSHHHDHDKRISLEEIGHKHCSHPYEL